MALLKATLATELQNMTPSLTPGAGETALANAYGEYMKSAIAGAVPIIAASIDTFAVPAMIAAMSFNPGDSSSQGAGVVKAGMLAFWGTMVAAPASFFSGATAITAPSFSNLQADLADVFDDNTATSASLEVATLAMADVIHAETDAQGTATFGVDVFPIT